MSRKVTKANARHDAEWWTPKVRDFVLFAGGFLGVVYETLLEHVDRPALLALFGGMLGLPVFLARDERSARDDSPGDDEGD